MTNKFCYGLDLYMFKFCSKTYHNSILSLSRKSTTGTYPISISQNKLKGNGKCYKDQCYEHMTKSVETRFDNLLSKVVLCTFFQIFFVKDLII